MIQYTISNDYTTVKFYDGTVGLKTESLKKVILLVSFRGLHIDMLKTNSDNFSVVYDEKGIFRIGDSDLQLLLPPLLKKMNQFHKTVYG